MSITITIIGLALITVCILLSINMLNGMISELSNNCDYAEPLCVKPYPLPNETDRNESQTEDGY